MIPSPLPEPGGPGTKPRASVVVAWIAIVAVVGFVGVRTWFDAHTPAAEHAGDDVALQMTSRNAVGYHILLETAGASPAARVRLREVSAQVVAQAHTPRQRLSAVAVIGELNGAAAALDELDRCEPKMDSPQLKADAATLRKLYTDSPTGLGPEARKRVVDDLGWYGRLAISFKAPTDDPSRQQIVSSALRALAATIAFEVLIGILLLAGIGLLTMTIVKLVDCKIHFAYQKSSVDAGPFLEAFALYLVGYVSIGYLIHIGHIQHRWIVYPLDIAWVAAACCWPLLRGIGWDELRRGLGWRAGRGIFREAIAGIGAYVTAMPLLAVAACVTGLLSTLTGEKPIHPIVFGAGGASRGAIIGLYLLASLWAPVVEETMFRGALFHHLRAGHRWLLSAVVSSLIFAALHPQGWTAIPILGTIGFIFAATREWRGTVMASGVAHALNNAVATTVMILVLG
jgi:membrane protease YdiL (CAAX protease family)